MPASFEVRSAFALRERGLFALSGVIRDGMVQTGMLASLVDADEGEGFEERVHGVEFGLLPGGEELPTLTFHYRDPAKLERWMALAWSGRTLALAL